MTYPIIEKGDDGMVRMQIDDERTIVLTVAEVEALTAFDQGGMRRVPDYALIEMLDGPEGVDLLRLSENLEASRDEGWREGYRAAADEHEHAGFALGWDACVVYLANHRWAMAMNEGPVRFGKKLPSFERVQETREILGWAGRSEEAYECRDQNQPGRPRP